LAPQRLTQGLFYHCYPFGHIRYAFGMRTFY